MAHCTVEKLESDFSFHPYDLISLESKKISCYKSNPNKIKAAQSETYQVIPHDLFSPAYAAIKVINGK